MTPTPPNTPSPDAAPAPLPPPRVPDHELIRRIGRGAYGEVWLARSVTGAYRAVKIVHRRSFDHDRPFEREFEGILKFEPISRRHDSQVDILHVGRGDDCFYYVMELADDQATGGQIHPDAYAPRTLKSDLMFHGRLSFEECVRIGIALATALEHLHANGLVHRDVKPSNIIFVNGVAKLADIGLVTGVDATRSYVGTEGFAAPEGPGSPQGDLYSLGKVLYELATGKDRQEFPELPTQLREMADRDGLMELNAVIARACRHDPKDRYDSAAAMRTDLELLQSGKSLARLHRTEARLRFVQRAGAAVTALAALIAAGWLWQARQTHLVRDLVNEKTMLAAEKTALAAENRERVVRLDIANGVRLLDAKDSSAALLWFADALPLVTNVAAVADIHRIRIQQTLNVTPRLLGLVGEGGNIGASAFSPDGSRLATAVGMPTGEKLTMRNARSGEVIWEQPPKRKALRQVRFAGDGRRLFVCSSEMQGLAGHAPAQSAFQVAEVLDVETGKQLLPRLSSNIECSAFSPDDHWLAVAFTNHVIGLLDMFSGQFTTELKGHTNDVLMLAFNGDGSLVASGSRDGSARVWRMPSGEPVGKPMTDDQPLRRVTLSADGRYLATATEESENAPNTRMQVWKVETGEKLGKPMTEKGSPRALFFGPAGPTSLLTGGEAGNPRIWDIGNDVTLQRTLSFENVRCWALSPDQRMLAMGTDSRYVTIWSTENWNKLFPPFRHTGYVESVNFSPDGKTLLTTSDDGTAKVWSLEMPAESARLELSANLPATPSQDAPPRGRTPGPVPTGLMDGGLHLIDPERLVEIQTLKAQPGNRSISAWVAGRAGRFWVVGGPPPDGHSTNELTLWAWQDGAFSWRNLPERPERVAVAQFNADESRLFTVTLGQNVLLVHIWRTSDGSLERSIPLPEGGEFLMPGWVSEPFQPNGQALLMCWFDDQRKQQLQLFDLVTSQWTGAPFPSANAAGALARARLSPDGTHLASVGGQIGIIIYLEKGQLVAPPFKHVGDLMDLDWSPDGKRLLTAGYDAKVWDASTGEMFGAPLEAHRSARWSRDGRFIATRGGDWFARVWDASTTEPVTPFLPHSGYIRWACITPGNRLITASDPNLMRAWDLKPTALPVDIIADYAKLLSGRRLSATGVLLPIPANELAELSRSLHSQAPELFE